MEHKSYELLRQDLSDAALEVAVGGLYAHYKSGDIYRVKGFTIDKETDNVEVRYSPEQADDIEFTRPLDSFTQTVPSGEPRFKLI